MFNFECMQHKGKPIGICIERYYVGSCCHFNSTVNELKIHSDQRPAEPAGPAANNSLKLRMVNKSNITAYIKSQVNKLLGDSTAVKRPEKAAANQPEKVAISPGQTGPTASEESDSANFINFTGLIDSSSTKSPIRLNYLEQTKPVNLIEHQTTISGPKRVNYLSTDSGSNGSVGSSGSVGSNGSIGSDGSASSTASVSSTVLASSPSPVSSSASPLAAESSPMPLNNSQVDRLIDYQLSTTEATSPSNAINFLNSSSSTLEIERFFMNQGRYRVSIFGREPLVESLSSSFF